MPLSALAARRLEAQRAQAAIKPIGDAKDSRGDSAPDKDILDSPETDNGRIRSSVRIRKRKRSGPLADDGPKKTDTAQERVSNESTDSRAMTGDAEMVDLPQIVGEISKDTTAAVVAVPISNHSPKSGIGIGSEAYSTDDEWNERDASPTGTNLEPLPDTQLSTISLSSLVSTSVDGRKAIVARLAPGQKVVAVGSFDLTVRKGSVAILGAILHSGEGTYRIHAFSTQSLPSIRALQHPKESRATSAEVTLVDCNDGLETLSHLGSAFIRLGASEKLSFEVLSKAADDTQARPLQALAEDGSWSALAQKLITRVEEGVPRIAICGSKGSGKSSFAQFLSNAMLSRQDAKGVAFLDVDPGQPEYSVPGHLSLGVVKAFNLGPPYTHPDTSLSSNETVKTHCFGFLTPRDDPDHYIACISDLITTYRRNTPSYPLLVNFSGWTFGQGKEALGKVLKVIQPTETIHMSTGRSDELSVQVELLSARKGSQSHSITSRAPFAQQRSAPELRRMQTMSYFHLADLRAALPTWVNVPLQHLSAQRWSFEGSEQVIDGVLYYRDSINSKLADKIAIGSVFSAVVVYGDGNIEQAFENFHHRADRAADPETGLWSDLRASRSRVEGVAMNDVSSSKSLYVVKQTQSRLLHVDALDGACRPLDPSTSEALGQVWVKEIDVNSGSLVVISPLILTLLKMQKKNGARILLVHGQGYAADWAILEPYHATSGKSMIGKHVDSDKHVRQENSTINETFDAPAWVRQTARAQLIDKRDSEAKKRRQAWRLRRNLETSDTNTRR